MKKKPTLVLAAIAIFAFFQASAQQTGKVTPSGIGYYEYLPDGYRSNSNRYPVVISLHGYKEKGTSSRDPELVLRDLPRVANISLPKYVKHGKKYPFILISPQLKSQYGAWPPSYIMEVLDHVKKTLRVDERRIYLTGLSLGGLGVWKTAGQYPDVFAAIVPICSGGNAIDKASAIAREDVAVWAFHGGSDHIVSHTVTTRMVNAINSAPQKPDPLAKVTIFPNMAHVIWDKAYLETDVLRWILTIRKGSGGDAAPPSNNHPVANAGRDQAITLPENSLSVEGKASDDDGEIVSYRWTKISGGTVTLRDTGSPTLRATDLREGTYVFRLTAKDDDGAADSDDVTVTVKAAENRSPVANAGSDRSLTLPLKDVKLQGTASDPDGKIAAYQWTKASGGAATMYGAESATLHVSNLQAGSYVFRFTAIDDRGAKDTDDVIVTVNKPAPEDLPPPNAARPSSVEIRPARFTGSEKDYRLKIKTKTINGKTVLIN